MNNQFNPNNMNGWQQQQQNIQRMQQQFKQQNTTSKGTRFALSFFLGLLPQLFLKIFGVANPETNKQIDIDAAIEASISYGYLWIIGIAIVIVSGILAAIFVKFSKDIKSDVIIPVTSMSAAMLSFTVFLYPGIGGNGVGMFFVAIFMAFVFYTVAAIVTWVILFAFMMSKMKKQFMNGQNPFQGMMNQNTQNPNINPNQQFTTRKRPQTKKELDEDLKQQGIDIDGLDKEFGTHFEPEDAQDIKGKTKSSKDEDKQE